VVRRIPEEDARRGSCTELVRCDHRLIRIAQTAEHTQVVVGRRSTKETLERCYGCCGMARTPIEEISSSGERLGPEGKGHSGVNEETAYIVIQGSYDSLSFSILS
jgi:hypothetical protein